MSETPLLPPPKPAPPSPRLKTGVSGPVLAGVLILLIAFGGFGTWSAFAHLSSAAIAPGVVAVEGSRKTVQHLEGGIIREILVEEGSRVEAGQVLLWLDPTRPKAMHDLLTGRYLAGVALAARLVAERDGLDAIPFPEEVVMSADDPEVAEIIRGQNRLFEARTTSREGRVAILDQRIAQFSEEITGLRAQKKAKEEQVALIEEELWGVRQLYEKGLEKKPRLLALERRAAELQGGIGEHVAMISRAKQSIGEAKLRILDLENEFQSEVATQLREVQEQVAELRDRLQAQTDVLERVEIRAPQAGTVVALRFHTPEGVIPPGAPILDIVPSEDKLVIDAQVRPDDIDVVHAGLSAQVRLSAYKRRTTPTVNGEVVHVSADRLVDERTGVPYYFARIEVHPEELEGLEDVELYPGMPAEVMIETGTRPAYEYLISPITNSLHRAFREQ